MLDANDFFIKDNGWILIVLVIAAVVAAMVVIVARRKRRVGGGGSVGDADMGGEDAPEYPLGLGSFDDSDGPSGGVLAEATTDA